MKLTTTPNDVEVFPLEIGEHKGKIWYRLSASGKHVWSVVVDACDEKLGRLIFRDFANRDFAQAFFYACSIKTNELDAAEEKQHQRYLEDEPERLAEEAEMERMIEANKHAR